MAFFDQIGKAAQSLGEGLGLGGVGDALSGTSKDAGILGVGQFKPGKYKIKDKAFTDDKDIEKEKRLVQKRQRAVSARQAPEMQAADIGGAAQIDTGAQEEFRQRQIALADQLAAQARGEGPSLASMQLQEGRDANIAQAMALAASQRGQTAGQGLRQIAEQATQATSQAAADAARARVAEQLAAREQLAGVAQTGRAADIGLATDQAALEQEEAIRQAELAQSAAGSNLESALETQRLKDAMSQFHTGAELGLGLEEREAARDLERLKAEQELGVQGVAQKAYEGASGRRGSLLAGIGEGIASVFSDVTLKKNIKDGEDGVMDMLDRVNADSNAPMTNGHRRLGKSIGKMSAPLGDMIGMGGDGGGGFMKMLGSLVGGAAAASDRDLKKNLEEDPEKLDEFLNAIKAYEYEYKDKEHGEGKYISPMAQDLEKSEIGKSMVLDTPEGKMVDYGRAAGSMLAATAMLNNKVDDLEEQLAEALKIKGGK